MVVKKKGTEKGERGGVMRTRRSYGARCGYEIGWKGIIKIFKIVKISRRLYIV